jgi:hypothetical protein
MLSRLSFFNIFLMKLPPEVTRVHRICAHVQGCDNQQKIICSQIDPQLSELIKMEISRVKSHYSRAVTLCHKSTQKEKEILFGVGCFFFLTGKLRKRCRCRQGARQRQLATKLCESKCAERTLINFSHPTIDMLFHDARHLAATTLQMTILNPSHLNRSGS